MLIIRFLPPLKLADFKEPEKQYVEKTLKVNKTCFFDGEFIKNKPHLYHDVWRFQIF